MVNTALEEVFLYTKEVYKRNLNNSEHIDSKIAKLFVFNTTLTLFFINTISFSVSKSLFAALYIVVVLLLSTSMVYLLIGYNPKGYETLDPNKLITHYVNKNYPTRKKLLSAMTGTIGHTVVSLKKNNNEKAIKFKYAAIFTVIAVVIMMLLKIVQS